MKSQFKRRVSLLCVLVLIVSVLSLSACGKDSDSIVGTWKTEPGTYILNNIVGITFYRDGSCTLDGGLYRDDYFIDTDDSYGTYSFIHDGTAIEFVINGSNCGYNYSLVSDGRLILSYGNSEYILTRID